MDISDFFSSPEEEQFYLEQLEDSFRVEDATLFLSDELVAHVGQVIESSAKIGIDFGIVNTEEVARAAIIAAMQFRSHGEVSK